jgi:hypothetical protein
MSVRMDRALRWLAVVVLPLLLGAEDPRSDLARCGSGAATDRPGLDIVEATGELIEDGAALAFTVTLAEPPDPTLDLPLRIDILLRDPRLPALDLRAYKDINRILRYEETETVRGIIFLLPETALSQPSTFNFTEGVLRLTVAARQLQLDEDLGGVDQRPVRWTVATRLGTVCDRLGNGRATHPLVEAAPSPTATPPPTSGPVTSPPPQAEEADGGGFPWIAVAVGAGAGVALILMVAAAAMVRDRVSSRHVPKHQDTSPP